MRDQPYFLFGQHAFRLLIPQRAYINLNSWTVAMEVVIGQGVCNNSPAELMYLDNGCRSSEAKTRAYFVVGRYKNKREIEFQFFLLE